MIRSANIALIFGPPLDGPDDDNSTCFSVLSRRSESPNARWQPREEDSEPLRERYVTPRFHLGEASLEYGRVAILKYSDPKFGTVDRFIAEQREGKSKRSIDRCKVGSPSPPPQFLSPKFFRDYLDRQRSWART